MGICYTIDENGHKGCYCCCCPPNPNGLGHAV